jgi:hypothetical protein
MRSDDNQAQWKGRLSMAAPLLDRAEPSYALGWAALAEPVVLGIAVGVGHRAAGRPGLFYCEPRHQYSRLEAL